MREGDRSREGGERGVGGIEWKGDVMGGEGEGTGGEGIWGSVKGERGGGG